MAVVVNETNPATLTCVATGIPEPNITWSVDLSMPIVDGFKYTISTDRNVQDSQNIAVTSSLTISDTSVGDSGTYSCEAENAAGAAEGTTELTVQGTYMHGTAYTKELVGSNCNIHTHVSSLMQIYNCLLSRLCLYCKYVCVIMFVHVETTPSSSPCP